MYFGNPSLYPYQHVDYLETNESRRFYHELISKARNLQSISSTSNFSWPSWSMLPKFLWANFQFICAALVISMMYSIILVGSLMPRNVFVLMVLVICVRPPLAFLLYSIWVADHYLCIWLNFWLNVSNGENIIGQENIFVVVHQFI